MRVASLWRGVVGLLLKAKEYSADDVCHANTYEYARTDSACNVGRGHTLLRTRSEIMKLYGRNDVPACPRNGARGATVCTPLLGIDGAVMFPDGEEEAWEFHVNLSRHAL